MILQTLVDGLIDLAAPTSPPPTPGIDTEGLADFLRRFFAPLFLAVVSVVAIFFLFTREITKFVQFILLAIGIATFLIEIPGNQLSRAVEASADAFALELTDDPQALIDLQVRFAETNLSDPDPPGWAQWAFGTHPSKLERIGAALAYERGG